MEFALTLLAGHICYHPDGYVWVPGEGAFRVLRGARPFELGRTDNKSIPHSGWLSLGAWNVLMRNEKET